MPKTKSKKPASSDSDSGPEDRAPVKKVKKSEDDLSWELGQRRKISLSEFKGKWYVNIREYYQGDDGEMKPGKKGIMLTMEQWRSLQSVTKEVEEAIKQNV